VKCVAVLCLVVTFSTAVAFAAHHHSNANESAQCTVCIVAHSTSPTAAIRPLDTAFVAVSIFRPNCLPARHHVAVFAQYVRPPPTV
jgi:hypothetical protein